MTPEQETRLRELPKLIANEGDTDKIKTLIAEFAQLLALKRNPQAA